MKKRVLLFSFFLTFLTHVLPAYDLEGKVRVESPYPKLIPLKVDEKHVADCGPEKLSPKLKISPEGFVANVVVKLEGSFPNLKFAVPKHDYILDQIQCEFSPHILLIPQKSTLVILNSEPILHNVRAFDEKIKMLFNDAMPIKSQVLKKRFPEPGRIIIRCGIHPWMHAIAIVQEHPYYAITDGSGYFKLTGIPEGSHRLALWHEVLGEMKTEVAPQQNFITLTFPVLTKPTE